jgi:para-nitrobenzyl esterase
MHIRGRQTSHLLAGGGRLLFGLAALGAPFLASIGARAATPVALTENGRVIGLEQSGVREFLGIRYAEPPVENQRWQPPQPLPGGVHDIQATQFGNHCPQAASPYGIASTTEDCLFLNVYAPAGAGHRDFGPDGRSLPVMVWIHGGALVVGLSNDYDPSRMVRQGKVIVVTINYRLGALGFLAQPALDAESHPAANYGLMDQQAALGWIDRNIAGFGGDPRNVTIFGESAGGLSTLSQLASPAAAGLFEHAIVESGAYALQLASLSQGETQGNSFAASVGCTGDPASAQTATCLRAVSVDKILANQPGGETPVVDGTVLPESLNTAFKTGAFNRVPIVNGSNHDEYRLFVASGFDLTANGPLTADQYTSTVNAAYGANASAVLDAYPTSNYPSPDLAYAALETDAVFACPALSVNNWVSQYGLTWAYEFNDPNAPEDFLPPASFPYASAHASELQFLFDIRSLPGTPPLSADEQTLSRYMIQYWTDFARIGSPNGDEAPYWPPYGQVYGQFQSLEPPAPATRTGFSAQHHCNLWTQINPVLQ